MLQKADKVLVDAPCSGLGVIRRKPEIKYKDITDFTELVEIQKKILNNYSKRHHDGRMHHGANNKGGNLSVRFSSHVILYDIKIEIFKVTSRNFQS